MELAIPLGEQRLNIANDMRDLQRTMALNVIRNIAIDARDYASSTIDTVRNRA